MSKIALLSTGDEVVEGEILNLNSQSIAEVITEHGFEIGRHQVCRDIESEIKSCLTLLLETHHCVIITGGLGPTADDRTRFAVADFINLPLVFFTPTWQWIEERYSNLNIAIPETNRQQAMFPQTAKVLFNEHGSADGCLLKHNNKIIVMLPGPPNECMPIVNKQVIPELKNNLVVSLSPLLKWRLFDISESLLAEEIETNFPDISSNIGYRWHYPYIDVKYRANKPEQAKKIKQQLDDYFKDYIICPVDSTASTSLQKIIENHPEHILIDDKVTGGLLQTIILSPSTSSKINFSVVDASFKGVQISIEGLKDYWQQNRQASETNFSLEIKKNNEHIFSNTFTIPNRVQGTISYVTELIASHIKKFLG